MFIDEAFTSLKNLLGVEQGILKTFAGDNDNNIFNYRLVNNDMNFSIKVHTKNYSNTVIIVVNKYYKNSDENTNLSNYINNHYGNSISIHNRSRFSSSIEFSQIYDISKDDNFITNLYNYINEIVTFLNNVYGDYLESIRSA